MGKRRKQIRNRVVDLIRAANLVDSDQVIPNRSFTYESKELPAISVYTRADEVTEELAETPSRNLRRIIDLVVQVVVRRDEDGKAADQLDDLCEEVEVILGRDDSFGSDSEGCPFADESTLSRIDFAFEQENIGQPVHSASLVWEVKYHEYFPREGDVKLDPFEGVDAEWNVGHHDESPDPGQEEDDRAEDTIDLPQT